MKHTPGPWYAIGSSVWHEDSHVADICSCDPATIDQGHLGRTQLEIEANAKLIAAAPDLLYALKLLFDAAQTYLPEYTHGLQTKRVISIARSAINKAKGETT